MIHIRKSIPQTLTATLPVLASFLLASSACAQWTVTNLRPAGSAESIALAGGGAQQAGYAIIGGIQRAGLWNGTAASWVNLNPFGSTQSKAYGTSGAQQVGVAIVGGVNRASLWSGTAASWVNLNPAGSTQSEAYGTDGTQQVGGVSVGGVGRASLWSGTAASWVDLHPAGFSDSFASSTNGTQQVGFVSVVGVSRASLWSGTAASWVDLHALLSAEYSSSAAYGISSDGTTLYITGFGFNDLTFVVEALLWTRPLCTAASIATQPQAATICTSGTATFLVVASGSGSFTYRWHKDTVAIDTATNPSAATQTLTLTSIGPADAGSYDCTVGNTCGSTISNPAALTVITCGGCSLADIAGGGELGNQPDGTIDGTDFIAFVNSFGIGDAGVDPAADVAGGGDDGLQPDGTIDGSDFIAFINAFAVGC